MGPAAVAILQGARLVTRSADTEFPFRQDSDFWYLTGFGHPHAVAVLRTDGGPPYTLFVEPRDEGAETWTGYRPGVEGARRDYGADAAFPIETLHEQLPGIIEHAERIFHTLGRSAALDQQLTEILDNLRVRSRQGVVPAEAIVDPRSRLHEMRLHKEPAEIEVMRRAAAISAEAHQQAAALAESGRFEYELEAMLCYAFRRRGATGPAYTSIVGGGDNATTLHYIANNQKLEGGDLVLVDAGCELEGYASDITRTYPVGGHFEGAARELYELVLSAQLAGLEAAQPGATLEQIHQTTVRVLTEGMLALGLLQGDADACIQDESYRRYYMHGTSHWLGLDVHDVGTYTLGGKSRPLEPGMVFTVEPGLYVPARDSHAPETFRGIGVRIEDDVVVTPDGHENLNTAIPKHPADVEAWMRL